MSVRPYLYILDLRADRSVRSVFFLVFMIKVRSRESSVNFKFGVAEKKALRTPGLALDTV